MQYFFLGFLILPFLFINYKIVISDLKIKIIPNKFLVLLLYLLPFYYLYLFFYLPEFNYLNFIIQIFLTFLFSFILFYFGIWAAGDAKYLLTLSLFIPYIGIIPFIGNIAVLTLLYLFGYFLWFYFGKCLFIKGYAKSLYKNIRTDLSSKWKVYKENKGGHTYKIILKWILIFLLIFISIRLSRIYLFASFFENTNNFFLLKNFIEKYNFYLILLLLVIFIGGLYIFKLFINKLKKYLIEKKKINTQKVGNIFLGILFLFLVGFIIFEYYKNPGELKIYLIRIFTIYLIFWVFFKVLKYSYKLTFGLAENYYIDIKDLKEGDIVDKIWLNKRLNFINSLGYKKLKLLYYKYKNNNFPIKILKKIINIINTLKLESGKKNLIKKVKILKTFSFGIYIYLGFLITIYFKDEIFIKLVNYIMELINIT